MNEIPNKFSISGLRGIAGEGINKEAIQGYIRAYLKVCAPSALVLGRDTRASGPEITTWVREILDEYSCDIIDVGIVTTPTGQFMTRTQSVDGGIIVTASHNPPEYNGIKFFTDEGKYLPEEIVERIKELKEIKSEARTLGTGAYTQIKNAPEMHVDHVLQCIDVKSIQESGITAVFDPDGGTGAGINPILIEKLGIKAISIYGDMSPTFPRGTEPTPENLKDLGKAVIKHNADIGFAQDPDADRLALVDEKGNPIGEEYTLVFATDHALNISQNPTQEIIVTNLSTSRMMDDVADKHGAQLIRTKIGEMHVAEGLRKHSGLIGGEGNGGIMWPKISWGRDSIVGIALILEYMAHTKKRVSELVSERPSYAVLKDKVELTDRAEIQSLYEKTQSIFKEYTIDTTEGIKVIFENGWLHVRASNTEPIVRIFAEAPSMEMAKEWVGKVKK